MGCKHKYHFINLEWIDDYQHANFICENCGKINTIKISTEDGRALYL